MSFQLPDNQPEFDEPVDSEYQEIQQQLQQKRKSNQYYVKVGQLKDQIRKYQQSKKNSPDGKGKISEQLGAMILKICTRFSLHPKFFGYSYRDQMIGDAVVRCLSKGLDHINLQLSNCNPFSYFTQITYNCFRARINMQKRYYEIKQDFQRKFYDDFEEQERVKKSTRYQYPEDGKTNNETYYQEDP